MGMAAETNSNRSSNDNNVSAMPLPHQLQLAAACGAVDDMVSMTNILHPPRWRSSLASGLRAALACTIVGLVSVYAPPALRRHITFPAFSYVVTVIIVTDATLGSALRAAVSALHATIMGAVPSVVALWLEHRTGAEESVLATTALVAFSTFAVALPESAGPVAKRIALGQIIIIYVARFKQGQHPSRAFSLVHPANVVACTALGVAAALLAVLLPCPRLATREATDMGRAYAEMAAERVRLLVDAFVFASNGGTTCAACSTGRRRRWCMAAACMASQAKRLASASANLLRRISSIKGDLQWERVPVLKLDCWVMPPPVVDEHKEKDHQLQRHDCIEMPLRGMEIALATSTSSAAANMNMNLKMNVMSCLQQMRGQIRLALLLTQNHQHCSSSSSSSSSSSHSMKYSSMMSTLPASCEELAPLLFLFSMDLLHRGTTKASDLEPKPVTTTSAAAASSHDSTKVMPAATQQESTDDAICLSEEVDGDRELEEGGVVGGEDDEEEQLPAKQTASLATGASSREKKTKSSSLLYQLCCVTISGMRRQRLMAAVKCAFSLGLAVLLGLLFSNDHGFWSGLIVATTMTASRESTWALAIARAHGTAIGSVYGVLGCLIVQTKMELRFLALLPWIVLATFLKRSRAYGPAGGVAAALSGIIIVGRPYDEPPMAFTIARMVETFIGLSCTVVADLVFQPAARPSAKARAQLARCLAALRDCFASSADDASAALGSGKCHYYSVVQEQVALLRKYAAEAGSEPSYLWLALFPAACYEKIEGSLSRMAQLLWLYLQARRRASCTLRSLSLRHHCHHNEEGNGTALLQLLDLDFQRFHSTVSTSLNRLCLQEMARSSAVFQKQEISGEHDLDLEAGLGKQSPRKRISSCCEEADMVVQSFLAHAREALLLVPQQEAEEDAESDQQQLDDDGQLQLGLVCLASIGFCMGEMIKEALQLEAHMLDLRLQPH